MAAIDAALASGQGRRRRRLGDERSRARGRGEFTHVLIPHEAHKPMVEYKHPKNTTLEDDDLREALKLHFRRAGR